MDPTDLTFQWRASSPNIPNYNTTEPFLFIENKNKSGILSFNAASPHQISKTEPYHQLLSWNKETE